MLKLDINTIIELYWGTNPAWNGYALAIFFNCGYQSIYNFMDKHGVLRRNKKEAQINYLKGIGVKKQLISKCPNCNIVLNFSKWIKPYKYLFYCPDCNKSFQNVKGRVTKPEDIEKVKKYKDIANKLATLYTEGEGVNR